MEIKTLLSLVIWFRWIISLLGETSKITELPYEKPVIPGTKRVIVMEGRHGWRSWKNEEFQEEDVWAVMRENFTTSKAESSTIISPRRLPSAAKMIPRANKNSSTTQQEPKKVQQSAPVNVPDWSKIYGNSSKKGSNGVMNGNWDSDDDDDDDGDGDGDGGKMMPPHEWIARKHDRSEVCCFSVCEGAGRTLKGRDLRRVRHAVLTRTGFLG